MKKFNLLLLIVAFFSAKAQTKGSITGKVTDKSNKQSIPYVTVLLLNDSSSKIRATVLTDANGNYSINNLIKGTYSLKFSLVGYANCDYKKIKIDLNSTVTISPQLEATALKLSEVVVQKPERKKIKYEREAGRNDMVSYYPSVSTGVVMYHEDFNTENYAKINDNEFKEVKNNPLSTLSIDVDKASYSNIRRILNEGRLPQPDAVRVEELINYFDYKYPQPIGKDPFSITTEYTECPWNKDHQLIHIGLQGKSIKTDKLSPSNLVFLLDVSGSMMSANKLPLVKSSMRLLVDQMREQDHISIVVYAGAAGLVLPSTNGTEKDKILSAIEALEAGGSTAGGAGIQLAYKTALENFKTYGNNRVILATDGDFNVGVSGDGELVNLIEKEREKGIYLTVLGFGTGNYKDSKMEQLADKGNGNYAYIDNLMEAKKVLVNEMGGTLLTIAKDVKIQIEFNPLKVKGYRLVGYENRLLNNEDFNDDKKDAGELGSGHTVTVIYEIIPAASNELMASVDPLKYQNVSVKTNNVSNEVMTIKFRYKEPTESTSNLITKVVDDKVKKLSNASENCMFACSVAQFGMLLRDSKFKGSSDFDSVITLAKQSKGTDEAGYRAEFIRLAEMAQLLKKSEAVK